MNPNLDYELYFNIAFFAVIGIGFLIGMIRGLRKSLYSLVVTAIFYGLFFLTIDVVINQLWVLPLPFVFSQLGGVMPELTSATSLGEAFVIVLDAQLGETLGATLSNEQFLAFVTGIALFAVKLVYTILYFTVGQLIYRFITFILRLMFLGKTQAMNDYQLARRQVKKMKWSNKKLRKIRKSVKKDYKALSRKEKKEQLKADRRMAKKKVRNKEFKRLKKETKLAVKQMSRKERRNMSKEDKRREKFILKNGYFFSERQLTQFLNKPSKQPLLGGIVGAAKGAVSAFVTLIILGGMISIMDSFLAVLPEDEPTVSREHLELIYLSNEPVYHPLNTPAEPLFEVPAELQEQLDAARAMIDAFHNNIFVSNASQITMEHENYLEATPLHLYLFDSVLSFSFQDETIMLRAELETFGETAGVLLDSEYMDTNDLSDITQAEIIALFDTISNSRLVTTMIPLGIEVGSEMYELEMELPTEELYAIDWQEELQAIGSVAAVGFHLVNTAGLLEDDPDLTTVTLDGTEVKDLFDSLAGSELATLGAYVALEPLLEQAGGQLSAIITVPEGIVWEDEFAAFGEVAKAVLDTEITMDQLSSGDPSIIITALANFDFTTLLQSSIISQAMINIFSGEAGLEGLDLIVIPDGIEWRDIGEGDDLIRGELFNILSAINAITDVAGEFSFDDLSISVIADFTEDTIDTIFASGVLVATISNFITNELDFGDTPLLIPDTVFDLNGYITSTEMKAVANSARILVTELPCTEGDTECEAVGFDLDSAFTLDATSIDDMVESEIIGATIGNLIIDSAGDVLTIPASAMAEISVDSTPTFVVSPGEISNLFQAISVMEFEDLEGLTFDATILGRLAQDDDATLLDTTKTATLFASTILHATISDVLIDLQETDDILAIPYFAEDNLTEIRYTDATDAIDYVTTDELNAILQALISIDITDFNNIDALDLNTIIDNSDELLASSILQATFSKQVLDLGGEAVTVPQKNEAGVAVQVTVGDAGAGTDTTYISVDEINAILDALVILNATDIQNFTGDVDLASVLADPTGVDTLLASATIHATISQQLFDLETSGTLAVPFFSESGDAIRVTVGDPGLETVYVTELEVRAMLDVLDLLGIVDNLDEFTGDIDLGTILADPANYDTLLASATIHATISKQLFDMETGGTLAVPYFKENNDPIRIKVGVYNVDPLLDTETEYVTELEVRAMLDVLDLLDIADNLDEFTGDIDLGTVLADPANYDILLASATIHATISKQLFDMETGGTLAVPYFKENNDPIRITVGVANVDPLLDTETEYVTELEVRAMLDVLTLLGITDNLDEFTGDIDMGTILSDPANYDTLLASATIHATISKQLFDMHDGGTLVVPFFEDDDTTAIRIGVGDAGEGTRTVYITEVEVRALLDALQVLGLTDNLEEFDGGVDIASATQDPTNKAILLASSTIQATISKQLIDLATDGSITLPYFDQDSTLVRFFVGTFDADPLLSTQTEYVSYTELDALIEAMNTLELTSDISSFTPDSVDLSILSEGTNADTVFASAMIQATVSKQVIDLVSDENLTDTFVVPYLQEDDATRVRFVRGDELQGTDTEYILRQELINLVKSLDILEITNVTSFSGDINIGAFFDSGNRTILLSSSILQATISAQLFEMGSATLPIPTYDIDNQLVRKTVALGDPTEEFEYVLVDEIDAMFGAFELLNITNLDNFTGVVDISVLDTGDPLTTEQNQNAVLSSASIHAKISDLLTTLSVDVLIVPMYTQAGETPGNELRITVDTTEFVTKSEVRALMNAFTAMGFSDLNTFGSDIESEKFFLARTTLLQSSSIQATISYKMINSTNGELVVPDTDIRPLTPFAIRLEHADGTVYIQIDELNAIFDGLEALNLTDFTTMNFNPATIFSADFNLVMTSASLQATISKNILATASDESAAYGTSTLIVPNALREAIVVDGDPTQHIEKDELINLLEALDLLDFTSFGGNVGGGSVTTMTSGDRAILLESGTMHTTIDYMLRGNALLDIPTLAETIAYGITLTTSTELNDFIGAIGVLGEADFTSAGLDLSAIIGLSTSDQDTVATSMIVRNTLHTEVYNTATNALVPNPFRALTPADYMGGDTGSFFTKAAFLEIVRHDYLTI
jgi:hypothetical protein